MAMGNLMSNKIALDNIYFVDGEQEARNYPVAFGARVLFLDSKSDYSYFKSVDQAGMVIAFKKYKMEEEPTEASNLAPVSNAQYTELKKDIDEIKNLLLQQKPQQRYNNNRHNNQSQRGE